VNWRLAVAAAAALTVAGCSSSSPPASTGSPTVSASSSPSASASPSASMSSSPTPTPSFSSTVQASSACRVQQLSLSLGGSQGAAGSTFQTIVFTNISHHACTLFGNPGVSFLDASGAQVGQTASFSRTDERATVALAPQGAANATLQLPDPGNFSASSCSPATTAKIRVIPPGDRSSLVAADSQTICTGSQGRPSVDPVTPGTGGQ
jgi:hypothetical protein